MQHIAFPLQQWLHERASVLLYAHCLYCFYMTMRHTIHAVSFSNGPEVLVLPSKKPQQAGPLVTERVKCLLNMHPAAMTP
jgi:hypothetical protein